MENLILSRGDMPAFVADLDALKNEIGGSSNFVFLQNQQNDDVVVLPNGVNMKHVFIPQGANVLELDMKFATAGDSFLITNLQNIDTIASYTSENGGEATQIQPRETYFIQISNPSNGYYLAVKLATTKPTTPNLIRMRLSGSVGVESVVVGGVNLKKIQVPNISFQQGVAWSGFKVVPNSFTFEPPITVLPYNPSICSEDISDPQSYHGNGINNGVYFLNRTTGQLWLPNSFTSVANCVVSYMYEI